MSTSKQTFADPHRRARLFAWTSARWNLTGWLTCGPCFLLGMLIFDAGWSPRTTHAQPPGLPSEAELPSNPRRPADLPSEGELPGTDQGKTADLPGEDQLPGQKAVAVAPGDQGDVSRPVGGETPILRLAFDGHTGVVQTLDISDGGRTLITAGEDKDVHVWRRTDIKDTGWLHLRTIRWPVTRGPRGSISTARLKQDWVAFAGYGAFGSLGEIRIVDVASGQLQQTLTDPQQGHLINVLSLAWSPESEPRLASVDMDGHLIVWSADETTGLWRPKTLVDVDEQTYGANIATALKQNVHRLFVPVTFVGPNYLVVPRYVRPAANSLDSVWQLQRVDLRTGQSVLIGGMDHINHIRAFSATDDGRVLASCDYGASTESGGSIGIWRFNGDSVSFGKFKPPVAPLSLDLDSDGKRLLVGTELEDEQTGLPARLQLWDIEANPPRLLSQRTVRDNVRAGVIDSQQNEAIITQGSHVEVHAFDADGDFSNQAPKRLAVPAKGLRQVAFAKDSDGYRIAFGWKPDAAGEEKLEGVFDLSDSKLLGRAPVDSSDYLGPQRTATRWKVGDATDHVGRFRWYEANQPRGMLPLVRYHHGSPTCSCTLPVEPRGTEEPDEKPRTGAVIVGTSGEHGIYAYQANASDPPELLRQFRDHSGAITSLSTSADGLYLASASEDATISIWNLQDIYTASKSVNRWGCDFEIEGSQLIAANVREDGPLYFRGVRGGDRLSLIEWIDNDAKSFAEANPEKMRQRLLDLPFDHLLKFKFTRLGRPGPHFQSLPAWRPLATLFVDQSREWAYWTPSGYYDASFNGHQRFGWQINNAIDQPVEYFRAAQFRKQLERPDIMRRLLAAGSLTAAMRQTVTQIGPPPAEGAIVNQIQSKPRIRLLSPVPNDIVEGDTLTVRASIEVPVGATLIDPKAFVSGVPAVDRQVVEPADDSAPDSVTYQWRFRLPSDKRLQLEILAATEAEAMDRVIVDLEHKSAEQPRAKPRLHVLAIGAGQYRDPQIQSLDFAAKAAGDVSDLFQEMSSKIYQTSADQLVDADATRPMWRVFAENAALELRQTVSPDDLVIMYLCGHGLRDRRTNRWYFVTADANYRDLMNDQYEDCIAFSDLAALSKLPCRKLAILDSCHSGAVQPLMQRDDLKSALRFLQDDVVLTLTASEGDEEAAEQRETRLGRFTTALVAALQGQAGEIDDDATVSLTEVIDYVAGRVATESQQDGMPQHPTASPEYLLRTLQLPLTSRNPAPKP